MGEVQRSVPNEHPRVRAGSLNTRGSLDTQPRALATVPGGLNPLRHLDSFFRAHPVITDVLATALLTLFGVPGRGERGAAGGRTAAGTDLDTVTDLVPAVAEAAGVSASQVSGALAERLMYQQIIDTMLLVVTGLLAVSVLIALIGVANTLSLSTIERTRENSLMRALGLTRRGLRTMLATEAVLIAGIAALLGSALGVFYGWMGAESLLGNLVAEGSAAGRLVPTVPWLELAAVVAVAVVAGLLASVGPSRRAARLSPVEGLAVL